MADSTLNLIGNVIGLIILIAASVWVYIDAKAIGDDHGLTPGLVNTKPATWAAGIILLLIVVLPVYAVVRLRYKRLAAKRREQLSPASPPDQEDLADTSGVWPPPPRTPAS